MTDQDCIAFLQWALPKLRMRWQGFRKVRKQVCKRIARRMQELDLPNAASYRSFLEAHPAEWNILDASCRVTISRFFRDQRVFQAIEREVLPRLARNAKAQGRKVVRCWSLGCASGEEPYTLALIWHFAVRRRFPGMNFRVIATDPDEEVLGRASAACYAGSSLWKLPEEWVRKGFVRTGKQYCLRDAVKGYVEFLGQDGRTAMPEGPFDLVLCRNIVFTYFEEGLQNDILDRIRARLRPGGTLVIGMHETLPRNVEGFAPSPEKSGIFLTVNEDQDPRGQGEQGQDGPASPEAQVKE